MNKKNLFLVFFIYVFAFFLCSFANAADAEKPAAEVKKIEDTKPAADATKKEEAKPATETKKPDDAKPAADAKKAEEAKPAADAKKSAPTRKAKKMFAVLEIESEGKPMGKIRIKLHHQLTPITVDNFVGLAEGTKEFTDPIPTKDGRLEKVKRPYYDGIIFHRIIPGFMIQGGDPTGTGTGGPGYEFKDEFHPSLTHNKKGILSMANRGPGTNGSQFFITLEATPHLDKKHTVFGEVEDEKSMKVVEAIGAVKRGRNDKPVKDVVIKKVTIEREY